jgi:glycosyltransferase involved in cell wall biosynthesis
MTPDTHTDITPTVSVIIPVYNGERHLAETIDSVIAQTYSDWELIAVNDGSPDSSLSILEEYGKRMPDRITVITVKNGGVSRARNTAVTAARGTYVAFLDQDDLWAPEKLDLQVEMFARDKNLGLVFTNTTIIDETGSIIRENVLKYGEEHRGNVFEYLLFDNFIGISTVMLKRELFVATGGFDPRFSLAEDYDLLLKVTQNAPADYIDNPLLHYREHTESGTHTKVGRLIDEALTISDYWKKQRPDLFKKNIFPYLKFRLKLEVLRLKMFVKRFV